MKKVDGFLENGTAECIRHGEHTDWKFSVKNKRINGINYPYRNIECRICVREHTRDWNRANPNYQDDYRYSRTGVINRMLSQARRRARDFSLPMTIDTQWVSETLQRQDNRCIYSNLPLDFSPPTGTGKRLRLPSLDQRIPQQGYTPENTVITCWGINLMKNDMSFDEFKVFCKAVAETDL